MTKKQWYDYVKRLDQCPDDCDQCQKRDECIKTHDSHADQCHFWMPSGLRKHRAKDEGNPCVSKVSSSIQLAPIGILTVCGCSAVGDGKWRRK